MQHRQAPPLREARARTVLVTSNSLFIDFADGRRLVVPLEWFPKIFEATDEQRLRHCLFDGGIYISWPELDETIEVAQLLSRIVPRSLVGTRDGERDPNAS